jgi:excisionase family DNA binding protein
VKDGWLATLKGIADYCGICQDTLEKRMKEFRMPIVKIGRRYYADRRALDEWLNYPTKRERLKNTPSVPH